MSEAQPIEPKPTSGPGRGLGLAGLKWAGLGWALGFEPSPAHHYLLCILYNMPKYVSWK
jgi:hypothetical protein